MTFEYDEDKKEFTLACPDVEESITLNKVYAFAFQRFLTRICQRNWLRKKKNV